MKPAFALPLVLAAAGCSTTMPADPAGMSPEQLRELAKDRSAVVSCVSTRSLAVDVTAVYLVLDRAVISAGAIEIGNACVVQIIASPESTQKP